MTSPVLPMSGPDTAPLADASATPAPRITIFDLLRTRSALDDVIDAYEGELTPELEAMFDTFGIAEREKADQYIASIRADRTMESHARGMMESARLTAERYASVAERKERLLLMYMQRRGIDEIPATLGRPRIVGNGGVQPLELLVTMDQLPARFTRTVQPPPETKIDTTGIRTALAAGDEEAQRVARLLPRGVRLEIDEKPRAKKEKVPKVGALTAAAAEGVTASNTVAPVVGATPMASTTSASPKPPAVTAVADGALL